MHKVSRLSAVAMTVVLLFGVLILSAPNPASGAAAALTPLTPTVVIKDGRAASAWAGRAPSQVSDTAVSFNDGIVRSGVNYSRIVNFRGGAPNVLGSKVFSLENYTNPPGISISDLDGSNSQRYTKPADGPIVGIAPDGWLEAVLAADGSSVGLRRATVAAGNTVTRTMIGTLQTAPSGLTITSVTPNQDTVRNSDKIAAFSVLFGYSNNTYYGKTTRVDYASNAVSTLGEQTEGANCFGWRVAAINQADVTLVSAYCKEAIRRVAADGAATTWILDLWGDQPVYDLNGSPVWTVGWGAPDAGHSFRGNADGTITDMGTPWWANRAVISVGSSVYYGDPTRGMIKTTAAGTPDSVLFGLTTDQLYIDSLDISAGRAAWVDNSRDDASTAATFTAWQRGIGTGSQAARRLILDRATGATIAQGGNSVFAISELGGLFKVTGTTKTPLDAGWSDLSVVGTSLFALSPTGDSTPSALFDINTGVKTSLGAFESTKTNDVEVSEKWFVRTDVTLATTPGGTETTAVVAKNRASGVETIVGEFAGRSYGLGIAGEFAVWSAANRVSWVDLANPASGVQSFAMSGMVTATDRSRYAVQSQSLVSVYTVGHTTPDFTVESDTLFDFDSVWAVWTQRTSDGDRLVAAKVPGTTGFTDVAATAPFAADITWLGTSGVTTGFTDGTFRPSGTVSREAMAAFLYRFRNPGQPDPTCTETTRTFTDVRTGGFCGPIEWLATTGITTGYPDGTYRPSATVTRAAMAAFLYRTLNPGQPDPTCTGTTRTFTDVPAGALCGPIEWLATTGITTGFPNGTYKPNDTVTRQAMAAFLHRADSL